MARARQATLGRPYPAPNGSGLGCDRGPAIGGPSRAPTRAEARWLAAQEMPRESRPWDEPKLGERHAGRAHAGRGQRVPIRPLVAPAARPQGPRRAPLARGRRLPRDTPGSSCWLTSDLDLQPKRVDRALWEYAIASDRRRVADVFRPLVGRTSGRRSGCRRTRRLTGVDPSAFSCGGAAPAGGRSLAAA